MYQISFAFMCFFSTMTLLTFSQSKFSSYAQHGHWFLKIVCLLLLLVGTAFMSADHLAVYSMVARYVAPFFLLYQLVMFIDFGYRLNGYLLDRDDEEKPLLCVPNGSGALHRKWMLAATILIYAAILAGVRSLDQRPRLGSQQPLCPPTAPEAHPLARGRPLGPGGEGSPRGCGRGAALRLAPRCLPPLADVAALEPAGIGWMYSSFNPSGEAACPFNAAITTITLLFVLLNTFVGLVRKAAPHAASIVSPAPQPTALACLGRTFQAPGRAAHSGRAAQPPRAQEKGCSCGHVGRPKSPILRRAFEAQVAPHASILTSAIVTGYCTILCYGALGSMHYEVGSDQEHCNPVADSANTGQVVLNIIIACGALALTG